MAQHTILKSQSRLNKFMMDHLKHAKYAILNNQLKNLMDLNVGTINSVKAVL
jgi:hypothetical protein